MLRKLVIATVTLLSLTFGVLSVNAGAQTSPTPVTVCTNPPYNTLFQGRCVTDLFAAQPTPAGAPVAPATDPAPTADTGDAALAFTGSESSVLGYVGAGMLGLGALAIGYRRKVISNNTKD